MDSRTPSAWAAFAFLGVAGMVLLLGACAAPPPAEKAPPPTTIRAQLQATADVNPDIDGRPSPVVVRFYELRSVGGFQSADFFSLYDNEAGTLGPELLAREAFTMRPGEQRSVTKTAEPEAQFVAVMAGYRDIDSARWRATLELRPHADNVLVIELGRDAVSIKAR
jgi:type VI secretion system protein VasD